MPYRILDGIRVLEIDAGIAGSYCASLLAAVGADVVLAEADGLDPLRRLPPFVRRSDGPGADGRLGDAPSVSFAYLSTDKEAVDATAGGVDALMASADILVTRSTSAAAPAYQRCASVNPALVYVDVTPFGGRSAHADLPGAELLVDALGGWLYGIGAPDREPVKPPGWQSSVLAGTLGAAAALAAVLDARESGRGDRVDLSQQAAVAWFLMNPTTVDSYSGAIWRRDGGVSPSNYPQGLMHCRDGPIGVNVMYYAEWDRFCAMLGRPEWRSDPRLATPILRLRNRDVIDADLLPWLAARTVDEAVHEAQKHKLPFAPVGNAATLLASEHLAARSYWQEVVHPGIGPVRQPGLPFRVVGEPSRPPLPAPSPGSTSADRVARRWRRTIDEAYRPAEDVAWRRPGRTAATTAAAAVGEPRLPLYGVRVVDLTMAWAGPMTTRVLAELGADVIKIESAGHMDRWRGGTSPQRGVDRYPDSHPGDRPWNRNAFFNSQNANKRSLVLDLKTARGKEILLDLVRESTMLVENFGAGAMGRLGLDYDALSAVRPDLVMLSMPAFGRTGPDRDFIAHGPTIEAAGGHVSLQGYAGGDPLPSGAFAWGDPVAGASGTLAALTGLARRALQGHGCHLDLSHLESAIPFTFPAVLDYAVNGVLHGPAGSHDPLVAYQSVLPCSGADRWVAVAAETPGAAQRLAGFTGLDAQDRDRNLTSALSAWSGDLSVADVVARLSELDGVACVPVLDAADLSRDAVLEDRGFFRTITHPEAGTHQYPGMPWNYDQRPWAVARAAPCFGADSAAVLTDVLGLSSDDVAQLIHSGVVATEPSTQGD